MGLRWWKMMNETRHDPVGGEGAADSVGIDADDELEFVMTEGK